LLQIEFHPLVYNQQMIDLLEFCRQEQIIVQGYSTFGEGVLVSDAEEQLQPQDLPLIRYCRRELESIAASLRLSRAQVLLRWSIQHGVWVIPKSTSHSHIQSNIMMKSAAKLSDVDMNRMDSLLDRFSADSGVEMPKKFCWNPDSVA
jgi:D-xylose reductase